jgi:hypothetical protein
LEGSEDFFPHLALLKTGFLALAAALTDALRAPKVICAPS